MFRGRDARVTGAKTILRYPHRIARDGQGEYTLAPAVLFTGTTDPLKVIRTELAHTGR